MRFSRLLKSSTQSLPSPNGAYIATILTSKLSIRATRSLEVLRVIPLPQELAASVKWFIWSASSNRILVGSSDNIRVYSATDPQFSANITNPTSGITKVAFVSFGATDDDVCVISDFGLKVSLFNLLTLKSADINSPKFYNPGVAARGLSYRPGTLNLALLTRSGGKDIISIHTRDTFDVKRSWLPETVDAQGLTWSPDGKWLAVWESAGQGNRLLIYTADGHLYKIWNGPIPVSEDETDLALGAGVRLFDWNQTGSHIAVGDFSRKITILAAPCFMESMTLLHATTIKPTDTIQIWQELVTSSQNGGFEREFVKAMQMTCPPASESSPTNDSSARTGTNILSFDNSGFLLASRTETMPTSIWIWDIRRRILSAVMILHAPIAKASWHPTIDGLLLIRCEGEESRGLVHIWRGSWDRPKIIDFGSQIPGGKVIGKTVGRWLNADSASPSIFFSDSQDCILASIQGLDDGTEVPWHEAEVRGFDIYGQREESPLILIPADAKGPCGRGSVQSLLEEEDGMLRNEWSDEVDDTFRFRKFLEPPKRGL